MDILALRKQFDRIGARVAVSPVVVERWQRTRGPGIDIGSDRTGEFFDIRVRPTEAVSYDVVDVQPRMRHLLLLARRDGGVKEKYLCGHDERHWFVCAVPERHGISGVVTAMQALQPTEVRIVAEQSLRPKLRLRRHNAAFIRQGEWFFVPAPDLVVDERRIHRNEPISRGGGGKPHWCEFLHRRDGEAVMVCRQHPGGLTMDEYERLIQAQPSARMWRWQARRRNATVYVRGRVSHPDHRTVVLPSWHRVLMNTESEAAASRNVVFLD
ncbi:hypothetical protein F8S13_25580 [Chloroflexia bacterium SDU3-3]|nr:hypothetical protein F8S13_25580 [Chloroflexia bacterium SDU3-3]